MPRNTAHSTMTPARLIVFRNSTRARLAAPRVRVGASRTARSGATPRAASATIARVRRPLRLLGPAAAILVCAASCEAILDIPERETAPNLVCSGPDDCSCQAPFADCREADVCDVDTRSDATNCGACGVNCLDQACVEGACACNQAPCKLVAPQCGCDEGLACAITEPTADNPMGRACEPAGTLGLGAPCGVELCAPGLLCIPDSDSGASCRVFCDSDEACSAGTLGQPGCGVTLTSGGVSVPEATVCSDDCDPVDDVGCADDAQCRIVDGVQDDQRWFTVCGKRGAVGLDMPCELNSECGSGLVCVASTGQCRPLCSSAQPCARGEECAPIGTVGTLPIGLCAP
jgi:hypothetical protein